jgi:hypothetical protein
MRRVLVMAVSLLTLSSAVSAQPLQGTAAVAGPERPSRPVRVQDVVMQLIDQAGPVRGRLLQLDGTRAVVRISNGEDNAAVPPSVVSFPLERVRHIDAVKADSVIEGAILGALYLAACARWWCHQGGDGDGPDLPKDVLLGAGLGALIGARIDGAIGKPPRLYEAPPSRSASALPAAMLGVRFTF